MIKKQIIQDINDYVGNDYHSGWYVGIATDIKKRLFTEHHVDEDNDRWIYCPADSESVARNTEKELLNIYNYDGGTGGGDHPTYVYAYRKHPHTVE